MVSIKVIAEYYNITIDEFFKLQRPAQIELIRKYYINNQFRQ